MSGRPAAALRARISAQHLVLGRVDARDVVGQRRVVVAEWLVHRPSTLPRRNRSVNSDSSSTSTIAAAPSACHSSSRRRGAGPAAAPPAAPRSGRLSSGEPRRIGFARVQRDDERRVGALADGAVGARRAHAVEARLVGLGRTVTVCRRVRVAGARRRASASATRRPACTISTRRSSAPSAISRLPPTVIAAVASPDGRARQVARRLLHQRQEAGADRQVGPLAVDGGRQQQDPAAARPRRRPARARRSRSAARSGGRARRARAPAA